MRRMMTLLAMCLMLSGCTLLVERVEGRLTWEADRLLIHRPGSGRCLLVKDAKTLLALRDSYRWCNFHLECCVDDPDFWAYVYRDGEQVDRLYGHDDDGVASYNADFVRRLSALGQAEPNAWAYAVTIPAGADADALAAQLGGEILPLQPEDAAPRHARLTAMHTTAFAERAEMTDAWWDWYPLGEFAGDAPLLPLRDALAAEGVLLYAGSVRMRTGYLTAEPGGTCCTRGVTFYLTGEPSFDSWPGLEIAYSPAPAWDALLVTAAPLSAEEQARWAAQTGMTFHD